MRRKRFWIMALALALILALLPVGHIAWAATVTVNSTTHVKDGDTSSIADLIADPGDDGVISLPEAIEAANNTPGSDTINFDISGCGGVCSIQPDGPLPFLSDGSTIIDGYTQPGALPATDTTPATLMIEIDGTNAGASDGFTIISAGNVIRGLVINRFLVSGVYIAGSGATGNAVSGNYIGTNADGTADLGNIWGGVSIDYGAQNNVVGGDTAGERNVISGNGRYGVYIAGSGTTGNNVWGNYIGTDASGTGDLANTWGGVHIGWGAQDNTVGGDTVSKRNVISGNDANGVFIAYSGTTSNTISGNFIGTDISGTQVLSNTHHGVHIGDGAQHNIVGGDTAAERNVISGNGMSGVYIQGSGTMSNTISGNFIGTDISGTQVLSNTQYGVYIGAGAQNNIVGPGNVIAHNLLDGVQVDGSSAIGNAITQNSIFSNTLGINLSDGANGGIAAPVIVTATVGSVNIMGTACTGCKVEVFENGDTDGEGETYLGDITADASGLFTVTVSFLSDPYLTATATDAVSGTSEFSAVFTATVTAVRVYLPMILRNY
jgi:hypothetical protein